MYPLLLFPTYNRSLTTTIEKRVKNIIFFNIISFYSTWNKRKEKEKKNSFIIKKIALIRKDQTCKNIFSMFLYALVLCFTYVQTI